MRAWQVERRKRTRHLIELGGLVVKAGIVDLTGDDRAMIYGALLWMADKLKSDQGEHARGALGRKGKQAFETEQKEGAPTASQDQQDRGVTDGGRRGDLKYRSAARHRAAFGQRRKCVWNTLRAFSDWGRRKSIRSCLIGIHPA